MLNKKIADEVEGSILFTSVIVGFCVSVLFAIALPSLNVLLFPLVSFLFLALLVLVVTAITTYTLLHGVSEIVEKVVNELMRSWLTTILEGIKGGLSNQSQKELDPVQEEIDREAEKGPDY